MSAAARAIRNFSSASGAHQSAVWLANSQYVGLLRAGNPRLRAIGRSATMPRVGSLEQCRQVGAVADWRSELARNTKTRRFSGTLGELPPTPEATSKQSVEIYTERWWH